MLYQLSYGRNECSRQDSNLHLSFNRRSIPTPTQGDQLFDCQRAERLNRQQGKPIQPSLVAEGGFEPKPTCSL